MHEYRVILEDKALDLESAANKYINKGWWLQGGVSIAVTPDGLVYAQAITRTVANEQVTQLQEQEATV